MLFDPESLKNKTQYLDAILGKTEIVNDIVSNYIAGSFQLTHIPRIWEPGGGATLFRIDSEDSCFLLKVKHASVWVESRLECDPNYLRIPSLGNENNFLQKLGSYNWVPKVLFYHEEHEYQFLAVEWLSTFNQATIDMSVEQLISAWESLSGAVNSLFALEIVHTDIHEHNICFRNGQVVLCDLEEARYLKQAVPFEESLDVCGSNRYGNVGQTPQNEGMIKGYSCLNRLKQLFKSMIKKKLPDFLTESNFDSSCPFNLDELQEPDSRIYQSIDTPDYQLAGQRPQKDERMALFSYLLGKLGQKNGAITHLDLGSNMGSFCFQASRLTFVAKSIGLEAYNKYVTASSALRFLYDYPKTYFYEFICGKDTFASLFASPKFLTDHNVPPKIDLVTMLSVYHHIQAKDAVLADLKSLSPRCLLVEFATQERYYMERGDLQTEIEHMRRILDYKHSHQLALSSDYRRPLILFTDDSLSILDSVFVRVLFSKYRPIAEGFLALIVRSAKWTERD